MNRSEWIGFSIAVILIVLGIAAMILSGVVSDPGILPTVDTTTEP